MVEIDNTSVRERHEGKVVISLPRSEVLSLKLIHGRRSERPLLQVLLFGSLFVVGLACAWGMWRGLMSRFVYLGTGCLVFAVYGLYETFRRGPVLLVETKSGMRRLFPAPSQVDALRSQLHH